MKIADEFNSPKECFCLKKIISIFLALIFAFLCVGCGEQNEKPYKDLLASNIASATVTLSPPNKTVQIDDIEKLVSLLRDIVICEEDNSYGEYNGQSVLFTLTMTDGRKEQARPFGDFFVINGTSYKTKYKHSEKLSNYANELLNKSVDIKDYEKTISYAGWSEDDKIYTSCLNIEQMSLNSVKHFPIFKIDTLKDLQDFKTNYGDVLSMNQGYDDIPSFKDVTNKYDEKFFDRNSLFVVYVTASSGSYRFDVESVYCDDDSFRVHIKQINNSEVVTADMAGWFVTVSVKDEIVSTCRFFDADLYVKN